MPPASPASAASHHVPTLGEATRFFLPLILMAEMMTIAQPLVHGFLARTEQPTISLAAFSAAFSLHAAVGGPVWTTPLVALGFIKDRASVRRMFGFSLWVACTLLACEVLIGLTPLGDWLYGGLMHVSGETARQAKLVNVVLALVMPMVVLRHIAQVMMMVHRQTIFVTFGAFVRLGVLLLLLPLTLRLFSGALVGAVAFTASLIGECLAMGWIGLRFYRQLDEQREEPPSYREIWHFGWPLMLNNSAETGVNLAINLFLGRLRTPERAVAAFGVVNGLMRLVLGPLRNLSQTTQSLVRHREDWATLLRFSGLTVVVFTAILGVMFCIPPVSRYLLQETIGLPAALYAYALPGLWMPILITPLLGCTALSRGLLSVLRNTRPIANASLARLAAVILWGALITTLLPGLNGVIFGMAAVLLGFCVDTAWMGRPLLRYWKREKLLS